MNIGTGKHIWILAGIMAALFLQSCTVEQKLARKYISDCKKESILIIPVDFTYRYNMGAYIDTTEFKTADLQDSAAFAQSYYLRFISDSIYLEKFYNSFIETLGKAGFNINVNNSSDAFFAQPQPSWIIDFTQLQIDEDYTVDTVEFYENEGQVQYEVMLFQVGMGIWIDLSPVNNDHSRKQTLYKRLFIEEDYDISTPFNFETGSFEYSIKMKEITPDDVYNMAPVAGKKFAGMLFDFLLNDYIRRNLPTSEPERDLWHYDLKTGSLRNIPFDKLELVR